MSMYPAAYIHLALTQTYYIVLCGVCKLCNCTTSGAEPCVVQVGTYIALTEPQQAFGLLV